MCRRGEGCWFWGGIRDASPPSLASTSSSSSSSASPLPSSSFIIISSINIARFFQCNVFTTRACIFHLFLVPCSWCDSIAAGNGLWERRLLSMDWGRGRAGGEKGTLSTGKVQRVITVPALRLNAVKTEKRVSGECDTRTRQHSSPTQSHSSPHRTRCIRSSSEPMTAYLNGGSLRVCCFRRVSYCTKRETSTGLPDRHRRKIWPPPA
jgi:hypothetical protein